MSKRPPPEPAAADIGKHYAEWRRYARAVLATCDRAAELVHTHTLPMEERAALAIDEGETPEARVKRAARRGEWVPLADDGEWEPERERVACCAEPDMQECFRLLGTAAFMCARCHARLQAGELQLRPDQVCELPAMVWPPRRPAMRSSIKRP